MERRLEEIDGGVSAHEEASKRSPLFVRWARQRRGEGSASAPVKKRLAIAQQLKVCCFVSKIDGDSPVFMGLAGCGSHGHPQVTWSMSWVTKDEDKVSQEDRGGGT
jgi:hypothetical protein